jgi:ABC-type antimicrobial peptide transport system permease subunit
MALGATRRQVIKIVIDQAVHVLLIGLLVGVLVVSLGERVLSSQVVGLMPNDISNWVTGSLVILLTGLAASYIPARRASRVDPNGALRHL